MTTESPTWPPGLGWDGHLLLVHATEEERRDQLAAWVGASLADGHRVLYVIDPGPGAADPLLDVLDERGVDGRGAVAAGALSVMPASEFYPCGAEALVARAVADGYAGLRMSGQASSALATLSPAQYREFELGMTTLCRELPASALCQYDVSVPSAWTLADTVDVHADTGVRHELLRSVGATGHLEVAGEVDTSDAALFAALVRAAVAGAGPGGELTVDLRGLLWLSAAGLHSLDDGTGPFRAGGGRVLLHVTPYSAVDRTLRLLDLNLPRGVELVGNG